MNRRRVMIRRRGQIHLLNALSRHRNGPTRHRNVLIRNRSVLNPRRSVLNRCSVQILRRVQNLPRPSVRGRR